MVLRKQNSAGKRPVWKMIVKWIGIALVAVVAAAALFVGGVRGVTYLADRIHTPNGVEEGLYVPLGGQEQYLLIRGQDTNNPVMIWLHGGPSSPDGFANDAFQKYLVDDYTIVNWDQRGCGRTYFRNQAADPRNETASFAQALADLDELVQYVKGRFHKEQVILVGHSYGTMLGSKYALTHPDQVAAYIGVGQFVTIQSDVYSYQDALASAKAKGDDTSAMEAAYQQFAADGSLKNMLTLERLVSKYHSAPKKANVIWLGVASPYMGLDDLRWFLKQVGDLDAYVALNQQLFDEMMATDVRAYGLTYEMPVGFVSGTDDWTTPTQYSRDYCDAISAPMKDFAVVDGCGHTPHYDAPTEFCSILKGMLEAFLKDR